MSINPYQPKKWWVSMAAKQRKKAAMANGQQRKRLTDESALGSTWLGLGIWSRNRNVITNPCSCPRIWTVCHLTNKFKS